MQWGYLVTIFLLIALQTTSLATGAIIVLTETLTNTLPYTLTGTNATASASIPQFPVSLGALTAVSIQQDHLVTVDALSQVNAGVYIPPNNIAGWNWNVIAGYQFSVPGGSGSAAYELSAYGNYDSPVTPESAEVFNTWSFPSNVISVPAGSVASYVGAGSVSSSMEIGITTAIAPLPATLAGFTWQPTPSKLIAGGISMEDQTTLTITYTYTPASIPEPSPLMLSAIFATSLLLKRRVFCG